MRIEYIHYFRGLAIAAIVANHCLTLSALPETSVFYRIIYSLVFNSSLWFVFIGGFLFQYLSGKFIYREYLTKKCFYVLFPYVVCSLPSILYLVNSLPVTNFYEYFLRIFEFYKHGSHDFQFWYIPMAARYYIISIALVWASRKGFLPYILPLTMIVSLVVLRSPDNYVNHNSVYFFSIYLLGMWVSLHQAAVCDFSRRSLVWLTIVSFGLLVTRNFLLEYHHIGVIDYLSKSLMCLVFIGAFSKYENKQLLKRIFAPLADLSFGIYFIHMYVLRGWVSLDFFSNVTSGMVFILLFVLTLWISVVFVQGVKKLTGKYSRFLVGS